MLAFALMAERTTKADKISGYLDELREIQDQYRELSDLHEKQKVYAEQLSEIVRALQREADATIPLRPSILGDQWSAAYLVSDAVVVMFDLHREMTSKPLSKFPPSVVVAVIEECASELGRQLAKKREAESEKVETLEKVLREISRAHPYRRAREEQPELEKVEPPAERAERSPSPPPMSVAEKRESQPVSERRESAAPEKRPAPVETKAASVIEKKEPVVERKEVRAPERREAPPVEKRVEQPVRIEPVEVAPQMRSSSSFVFKGSYGQSKEEEASY
jgi:hypothetical protein